MQPNDLPYEAIEAGHTFSFERTFTKEDVEAFAALSGDRNPLHLDEEFGSKSPFGSTIVHGMLTANLFSTLMGMYCPGKRNLYLSQSLHFTSPVYRNEKLKVEGEVLRKSDSTKTITIRTTVYKEDETIALHGEALVKVM